MTYELTERARDIITTRRQELRAQGCPREKINPKLVDDFGSMPVDAYFGGTVRRYDNTKKRAGFC